MFKFVLNTRFLINKTTHIHTYDINVPESLQLGSMFDVSDVGGVFAEIGLNLTIHGMVWLHHQCRMVAHLTQVLQSLNGEEKRAEDDNGRKMKEYSQCMHYS